jgi:predicted RNase H-like nuclease (RuvC/YqgF family)
MFGFVGTALLGIFFVLMLARLDAQDKEMKKIIEDQQRQIDNLKCELEEMKRKE